MKVVLREATEASVTQLAPSPFPVVCPRLAIFSGGGTVYQIYGFNIGQDRTRKERQLFSQT